MAFNSAAGRTTIRMSNGWETSAPCDTEPPDGISDPVARRTHRFGDQTVEMVTTWGDVIEVEQYDFDDQDVRRAGRPTIYLDQNIWIQLGRAIYRPEVLSDTDLRAALDLVQRAQARELILPLASSHLVEVGPTYGTRRERIASTMVGLSRGWVLRDPMQVRFLELSDMFLRNTGRSAAIIEAPMITLDHRAWFPEPFAITNHNHEGSSLIALAVDAMSGASSVLSTLLSTDEVPRVRWVEEEWAEANGDFAAAVPPGTRQEELRQLTLAWFLQDVAQHLSAAAGMSAVSVASFKEWWSSAAEADIAALPYLGRAREVMHRRLSNCEGPWEANDLVDLTYLPCAAAYADHVVCERRTAADLRAVQKRLSGGAQIHRSVAELLRSLDAV